MAEGSIVNEVEDEPKQGRRDRVQGVLDADPKLTRTTGEIRWDRFGERAGDPGVYLFRSSRTDCWYAWDPATCAFWRGKSPGIRKLTSCSPREVIDPDRTGLYQILPDLEGWERLRARWHAGAQGLGLGLAAVEAAEEAEEAAPDPEPFDPAEIVERTERKVLRIEEEHHEISLSIYQLTTLLRRAGKVVPDEAVLSLSPEGYALVTWTVRNETIE